MLGHDLGHTPFGHSGERVMDELMRDHGGFEHNRQTLRILEVLEERYPGVPGPEPHLGGARGDDQAPAGERRRTRPPEYAPGEAPDAGGAARRFRGRDRLQQPRRRRRPDVGDVHRRRRSARCALFREAHDEVLAARHRGRAHPSATRSSAASSTAARRDLLETTLATLQAARVRIGGRRAAARAAGWSPTRRRWRPRVRELKDFLLQEHVPPLPGGAHGGQGRAASCATCSQSYVGRAAAAAAAVPGAHRAATASTAWCATTSRA